jgi:hypothetical protein
MAVWPVWYSDICKCFIELRWRPCGLRTTCKSGGSKIQRLKAQSAAQSPSVANETPRGSVAVAGQSRETERLEAHDDCDVLAGLLFLGFAQGDEVAEAPADELDFMLISLTN